MARPFKLPDLGEGIHEAEIISVLVSVGDEIEEGNSILEVETDKAVVEIPSPFTGTVEEILVKAGDTVKVNDILMTFSNREKPSTARGKESTEKVEEKVEQPFPGPEKGQKEGPVPASPATRHLARELGVDLHRIPPTGPAGLVTAEDVRAFAEQSTKKGPPARSAEKGSAGIQPISPPSAQPLPDFAKYGPVERIPVRSLRRATAKQMALSWSQIPHANTQADVDITKLEEFRRRHKTAIEAMGGKLTLTVLALKAAVTALKASPEFNASLDGESGDIIIKHYYNIGIAVDTDEGLVVPVIRDVDRKSIKELSVELHDLIQRTRNRKISLEEMQGGTFSITNVGSVGNAGHFAPIIKYPEVAILGMGSARMQPVVTEKGGNGYEIVPRLIMPIVVCIDHRVLDGADAIRFMRTISEILEDPEDLLISMT